MLELVCAPRQAQSGQRERANTPVNPTKATTVILCAESKNGLDLARIESKRDTFAFLAAWCAARSRATLCSGVSAPDEDPAELGDFAGPDGIGLAAPEPILEDAWGVVGVKRVADEAVRSPFLGGMVRSGGRAAKKRLLHELNRACGERRNGIVFRRTVGVCCRMLHKIDGIIRFSYAGASPNRPSAIGCISVGRRH